jgi:hypothetical protein
MKISEFRKLIREEVRKIVKESVDKDIFMMFADGMKDIDGMKLINPLKKSITGVKKGPSSEYTIQIDPNKLKSDLTQNPKYTLEVDSEGQISLNYNNKYFAQIYNLPTQSFNILKTLDPNYKLNPAQEYVDSIVDLASSGAGAATGLQSKELANIVKKIKASNLTNAVDRALVKYINNTDEAFTENDIEVLQAVGFKMSGVNYDNLGL